jgi:O-antigen ligase
LALVATRLALRGQLPVQRRQGQPVVLVGGCLFVALLLAMVIVLSNSSTQMDASRVPIIGSLVSRIAESTRPDSESTNNITLRQEMWRYAIMTTAQDNPFFGRGAGHPVAAPGFGFRIQIDPRSGVHNSFVGYAFYSGFPSAILVSVAFALAIAGCWRNRAHHAHASLFGATIAVAITCATNIALETPYIAGPAWAVIGAAVGAASARAGTAQSQHRPLSRSRGKPSRKGVRAEPRAGA